MKIFLFAAIVTLQSSLFALCFSPSAAAQTNRSVVESQPFIPGQAATSNQNSNSASSEAMSLLLDQIKSLRLESQALRALIEEQEFEIRKLQRDSLSRYTNIDNRLSSIEQTEPAAPTGTSITPISTIQEDPNHSTPPVVTNVPPGTETRSPLTTIPSSRSPANSNPDQSPLRRTLEPVVLSEQQLYQMAYNSVISSNFERSIAEFDQYLSIYGEGRFFINAHYWKGQAFLNLSRFNEARVSYELILDQYPDSLKSPEAMYGLASAYESLGNMGRARQLLSDLQRRFPGTGAANLADVRLLSLE